MYFNDVGHKKLAHVIVIPIQNSEMERKSRITFVTQ